jgi:hypothetical protein
MQLKDKYGQFDISAISLGEEFEFETQYMMSGEDTAIINFDVVAAKEQIAALAEKTDIVDNMYHGDMQLFYDKLFDETIDCAIRAELCSNVYCSSDNRSYSTARLLLECDDDSVCSVNSDWDVELSEDEQYKLKAMMEECAKGLSLETLIHYSKQASLEDVALRNAQNGMQIITDLAVLDGTRISGMNTEDLFFLVYDLSLDSTDKATLDLLRNRCVWEYNADCYANGDEDMTGDFSLTVTITSDNTEIALVERAERGVQSFNIPIVQEEKNMIKDLVTALDTRQMEYTDIERTADGSYNLRLSDNDIAVFVDREPEFKRFGAHPYENLLLETDADFFINVTTLADNVIIAHLCMNSDELGNKEFPLTLSQNERRALINTVIALEADTVKEETHSQSEISGRKTRNKCTYER